MRWPTSAAGFVVGICFVLALVGSLLWRQLPGVAPQGRKTGPLPAALAAEDPCVQARKLFNEAAGLNDAVRERALLEQALACQCQDELILAYIYNNLGDALERLGQREEALRHYGAAYSLFPYEDTIKKNMVRLLEGLDEATAQRLTAAGRVQAARELVGKLDLGTHQKRLRSWRKIAVEWEKPDAAATSGALPPPPSGLSWLPTVIIYFDFDSDVLRPESEAQLRELKLALNHPALKGSSFRLEGHTCDLGSEAYNQQLSARRAESVKKWLAQHEVDAARLFVRGYGKSRPLVANTAGARHLNRRVQVVMIGAAVSSATRRGAADWLQQDLERVAKLIEAGAWEEAAAILDRLEAKIPQHAPGDAKERIAANRALINLGRSIQNETP